MLSTSVRTLYVGHELEAGGSRSIPGRDAAEVMEGEEVMLLLETCGLHPRLH